MNTYVRICSLLGAGLLLVVMIFAASTAESGSRSVGIVENIDGIPFAGQAEALVISETLAHADIYLTEPVAFKALELDITFDPQELASLAVGVRGDSFWLSYPKQQIYSTDTHQSGIQSAHVIVPLTDRFQETDRSIDLMFFAQTAEESGIDQGINDITMWKLYNMKAHVLLVWPTYAELKDYVRSVLYRERAA